MRLSIDKSEKKAEKVTLEEALDATKVGLYTVKVMCFCGLLMMGTVLETLGFGYVLPGAQCTLGISQDLYTWAAAIPFAGYILTSHIWGWSADRWGRKKALAVSLSVGSLLSLLSSLSPNTETFITLRLAASLFIGGGASLGYAFLGEMCPEYSRVTVITLGNAAVASGTGVVPLLAWAILPLDFTAQLLSLEYRPWRLLIAVFALPHVISTIACYWIDESPKFLSSAGRDEEALEVLKTMYAVNTGNTQDSYPVASLKSESEEKNNHKSALRTVWDQTKRIVTPPLLKYTIIFSFSNFVVFGTSNAFYIWLPEVVTKVMGSADDSSLDTLADLSLCKLLNRNNQANNSILNATIAATDVLCNDKIRTEAFTIAIYLSIALTSLTVISAFAAPVLGKRNLTMLFIFVVSASSASLLLLRHPRLAVLTYAGLQLGGSIIGFVGAFSVQLYPTEIRAMGVCLTMMIGRLGSLVYTKIIGVLLVSACPAAFYITSSMLLLMFAVVLLLPKDDSPRCRPKKIPD